MKVAFLQSGVGFRVVQWVFSGVLVAVSVGVVAFAGWLVRRLFTTEPRDADS